MVTIPLNVFLLCYDFVCRGSQSPEKKLMSFFVFILNFASGANRSRGKGAKEEKKKVWVIKHLITFTVLYAAG